MRVVIIDNNDSYTNNIAALVQSLTGTRPWIMGNDVTLEAVKRIAPEAIILSAGPGDPQTAGGICRQVIDAFEDTRMLGVCLGHQLMALHFGGAVRRVEEPRHGTTVEVTHDGTGLFAGLPQGFQAMRYHSLTAVTDLATASGGGETLALQHPTRPLYGVQFHPESVSSEYGRELMANFLGLRWEASLETHFPADAALLHEAFFGSEKTSFLVRHPERYTFVGTGEETRTLVATRAMTAGFPFGSGVVGVVDYDGDARALQVQRCLVVDHQAQKVHVVATGSSKPDAEAQVAAFKRELEAKPLQPKPQPEGVSEGRFLLDEAQYTEAIEKCFAFIRAGECYELCLTNRFEGTTTFDAWTLYRRLHARNPSPYAALLRFSDTALIMSSPERFVRVENGIAETRPIKGTRRRGHSLDEDAQLRQQLALSEKDRRENLMIVDVSRHDLGAVAEEVTVPQLLQVEAHPTVFQLVSTVRARLKEDAASAVTALMPPASMTGAPKARAVELLRTLEPTPRGFYSGCAGWLSASGDADFAVVIRSLRLDGNRVRFGVGGAIVLGSQPKDEWEEIQLKARALLDALNL